MSKKNMLNLASVFIDPLSRLIQMLSKPTNEASSDSVSRIENIDDFKGGIVFLD